MENASKALIMAGGLLIAIVIISIAVYLFTQNADFSRKYEEVLSDEALEAYNAQFEKYCRYSEKNKNGEYESYSIASDIVTVINKAYDINQKDNPSDYITIEIKMEDLGTYVFDNTTEAGVIGYKKNGSHIEDNSLTIKEFLERYSATGLNEEKNNYKYRQNETSSIYYEYIFVCNNIRYHTNGKIESISFKMIKNK